MRIYSKKAFAFVNPDAGSLLDLKDATAAEVKVFPGGFHTVPDWVASDDMFKWALADGDIVVTEEPKVFSVEMPKAVDPFEGKSAKELYELCLERNIEVEAKKSRPYYIEFLTAAVEEEKEEE